MKHIKQFLTILSLVSFLLAFTGMAAAYEFMINTEKEQFVYDENIIITGEINNDDDFEKELHLYFYVFPPEGGMMPQPRYINLKLAPKEKKIIPLLEQPVKTFSSKDGTHKIIVTLSEDISENLYSYSSDSFEAFAKEISIGGIPPVYDYKIFYCPCSSGSCDDCRNSLPILIGDFDSVLVKTESEYEDTELISSCGTVEKQDRANFIITPNNDETCQLKFTFSVRDTTRTITKELMLREHPPEIETYNAKDLIEADKLQLKTNKDFQKKVLKDNKMDLSPRGNHRIISGLIKLLKSSIFFVGIAGIVVFVKRKMVKKKLSLKRSKNRKI